MNIFTSNSTLYRAAIAVSTQLIIVVVLLAFIAAIGMARTAQSSSILGDYACSGTQFDEPYTMHLFVEPYGETFQFHWSPEKGAPANLIGLAVQQGDQLGVAIVSQSGGIGSGIYRISPGRLDAVWTRGDGKADEEHCWREGKDA